jgi:hypothetical protein
VLVTAFLLSEERQIERENKTKKQLLLVRENRHRVRTELEFEGCFLKLLRRRRRRWFCDGLKVVFIALQVLGSLKCEISGSWGLFVGFLTDLLREVIVAIIEGFNCCD